MRLTTTRVVIKQREKRVYLGILVSDSVLFFTFEEGMIGRSGVIRY